MNKAWNQYLGQHGIRESSTLSHPLIHCHVFYIYNDSGMLSPNYVVAVSKLIK